MPEPLKKALTFVATAIPVLTVGQRLDTSIYHHLNKQRLGALVCDGHLGT
ncbi:hypothetical protein [Allocoleopsis franciscana]|nr:hypothetical protein [Allocoleopsis franciscana]